MATRTGLVEQRAADRRNLIGVARTIYWEEFNAGASHNEALLTAYSYVRGQG